MAEPIVQVPVSLLARVLVNDDALDAGQAELELLRLIDEQVSQPTPTAESDDVELCDCGEPAAVCAAKRAIPAAPPRIADMVPGTTLDEALRWTVRRDRHGNTFLRRHDRSGAYVECWPRDIDPSTIRDVTPPSVTP